MAEKTAKQTVFRRLSAEKENKGGVWATKYLTRLKFVLAGAVLGVAINAIYFVGWRFGGLSQEFLPVIRVGSLPVSLQSVFVCFAAVVVGTYVGLWTVGKVKIGSPVEGLVVGLLVFVISVPVTVTLVSLLFWISDVSSEFLWRYVYSSIVPTVIEDAVGSLCGGFLGGLVVLWAAPEFCPKCGRKIGAGVVYCSNCGWGRS